MLSYTVAQIWPFLQSKSVSAIQIYYVLRWRLTVLKNESLSNSFKLLILLMKQHTPKLPNQIKKPNITMRSLKKKKKEIKLSLKECLPCTSHFICITQFQLQSNSIKLAFLLYFILISNYKKHHYFI